VEWASWDAHRASRVDGSPASPSKVFGTMTGVGGPNYLGGSTTTSIFGTVAGEAIGVKILIMILTSANLVYHYLY